MVEALQVKGWSTRKVLLQEVGRCKSFQPKFHRVSWPGTPGKSDFRVLTAGPVKT